MAGQYPPVFWFYLLAFLASLAGLVALLLYVRRAHAPRPLAPEPAAAAPAAEATPEDDASAPSGAERKE